MSSGTDHGHAGSLSPPELVDIVSAAVSGHLPADPRERDACAEILVTLKELDRPFDEHADARHVTGSAVIVGPRGTVLHLHKRLHRWIQPGGHVEAGETPWEAALRESVEETGLDVTHPGGTPCLVHVDVHAAAKGHVHLDLRYLLLAGDEDPKPRPGESAEVRWYSWDEAMEMADEALVGALRTAKRTVDSGMNP